MKAFSIRVSSLLLLALTVSLQAAEPAQKWNMARGDVSTAKGTQELIDLLKLSKKAGCTHVLLPEQSMCRIPKQGPEYAQNVAKALAAAKEMNLTIVPYVWHVGYSGRYMRDDGNLAAGLPVKDMLFTVKGDIALADPAAVDTSGLKEDSGHLRGKIAVKPFHHYVVSFYTSQKPAGDMDEYLQIDSAPRRHCRTFPAVTEDGESYFVKVTFNSLDAKELSFNLAAPPSKISHLKIESAGALLIVRRPRVPLTVTSEDGQTRYEEGKDYKPLFDPYMNAKPFPGQIEISHQPAALELTADSRIKSGQKLKLSFWHAYRIRGDQVSMSVDDPKAMELLEDEVKNVVKLWGGDHIALDYEEMRMQGWEPYPEGKDLTPGQMLAKHVAFACETVRKYSPKATIYTWSDMFCPGHNARPFSSGKSFYYLVNGNWDGSWEGLPKDVVVLNWYSPDDKNVKFFADRGHRQVLCAFGDKQDTAGLKDRISKWVGVSRGVPGVNGWLFVTYQPQWQNMKEMFNLIDTYSQWGKPATTTTGPREKPPGETD